MEVTRQFIENLIHSTPGECAVYLVDGGLKTLAYSDGVPRNTGYTSSEYNRIAAENPYAIIMESDRPYVQKAITDFLHGGSKNVCTYRLIHKTKEAVWVRTVVTRIGEMNGKPVLLASIMNASNAFEMHASLLDESDIVTYVCDAHTFELLYANRAAKNLWGRGDYSGRSCFEFIQGRKSVCAQCLSKKLTGDSRHCSEFFDEKYKRYFQIDCKQIAWYERDAFVFFLADVSARVLERKAAEEKYADAMQDLLAANPRSLCTFRLNLSQNTCGGGHGISSQALENLFSETVDGLLDNIAQLILVAPDKKEFLRKFNRASLLKDFSAGRGKTVADYRRLMPGGEMRWVSSYVSMMRNPVTGDVEAVLYSVDIDDQKKEEQIVQRLTSEEFEFIALIDVHSRMITFRNIGSADAAPMPAYSADYNTEIFYMVDHFVLEGDREECRRNLAFENVLAHLSLSGAFTYAYSQPSRSGILRKRLTFYWLDDTRRYAIAIKRDITNVYTQDQQRLHQVQNALDAVEQASEAKSVFLSSISHDMRTPLNGIIGFTNLALGTDEPAQIRNYLGKIKISGALLLDLINDTLTLSKIESGKLLLNPQAFEGRVVRENLIVPIRASAEDKKVKFSADLSGMPRFRIMMDCLNIQKILLNLLSNAIKFTPAGGTVSLTARVEKETPDNIECRFVIRDTGAGISSGFQKKMYEPFTQERADKVNNVTGTGLGLSIVKKLVNLMDGSISVKSKLGAGTEFTVIVPFAKASAEDAPVNIAERESSSVSLKGKKILFCEDNVLNTEIAEALVEHQGMIDVCAVDGAEGVRKFSESAEGLFDAVLMDIRMPEMTGYEATREIGALARPDAKNIPIIAMTADAYDDDVKKCFSAGMNEHISKPIDPALLYRTLQKFCC